MTTSLDSLAKALELRPTDLVRYGDDKAKVRLEAIAGRPSRGKLILVTAMSPSPAGEGKTTTAIGLTDALNRLGRNAAVALREPSMGPVFGMKGGGAGGGMAQLVPADEINLHFTGDFHAITSAHNLLAAAVDNHIHFGNPLGFDTREPTWQRVLDVNDRALREMVIGLGGKLGGVPRQARFDITAASEIMAVLALANSRDDLFERLSRLVVGRTSEGEMIRADALNAQGSLAVLLKDALLPNLVQTLEGSPALVHAGPFGNIAHGTNSVMATQAALGGADLVVQEAGFGADLGAEKFAHIFCPSARVWPALSVLVVTLRAMRYHAGVPAAKLAEPDASAVTKGLANPLRHIENLKKWGLPVVVAINLRAEDSPEDLQAALQGFSQAGVTAIPVDVYRHGGGGALELAEYVASNCDHPTAQQPVYTPEQSLLDKIAAIAASVYRASGVILSKEAERQLATLQQQGFGQSGVCIAKTQYSFSDDATRVGVVDHHDLHIREIRLAAGAGFVVAVSGEIMTMPGLARQPNLEKITLGPDGRAVLY
jgi:formate--tetrahydrofolate ligase